jgi:hypothetical protein
MEQERRKKLTSKQERRDAMGGGATFGPKETHETVMFQKLKKQQDTTKMRDELQTQMLAKQLNEDMGHKRMNYIDNHNIQRA